MASSETARHMNCRVILNLIREKQPISRADLARLSGLQRSTISLITESLIEEKWVVEGTTGRLPRGRRPTFLLLNQRRKILCVDIRPAKTFIGISDVNGTFEFQEAIATDPDPYQAIRNLIRRLQRLVRAQKRAEPFEGIGISVPGRMDLENERLVFAPNLKWPPVDLKTPIEKALGLETVLENAANACALAEMWFGQSEPMRNLVVITVSEGIGTGIIAEGVLVKGQTGMAGELGHFALDLNGPECACGNRGCWEVLASERAGLRYYFESLSKEEKTRRKSLDFRKLLTLAEEGDEKAIRALDRMAMQLARGVRMIVAGLAPDGIVFVGDFTTAWGRFEPIIKDQIRQQSINGDSTRILPARDHENARLRGTVALVLQKHFRVPVRV